MTIRNSLPWIATLLTLACPAPQPVLQPPAPPEPVRTVILTEAQSTPAKAQLLFKGKAIGPTPQSLSLDGAGDLLELTAARNGETAVEKRIRFLTPERAEVHFVFAKDRTAMAKALGLTRILVFEYGAGITFDVDASALKAEFRPLLARQAELLTSHFAGLDIHVCGHTDNTGERSHNLGLSLARAKAVADELAALGVPKARLKIQGFGSDYPVAWNDTPENRTLNRRTELILPQ